ncbi:hypothetical protein LuPra_02605 [Luteitalea pratensis]|uniref:Translocation protein TolB n=1 Tax=Luteitalea pratensis TaxID=1855912 RepID=A0A143PMI0_LUTPR|nr:PD40 domain-containing protein [Luteitalea pratensis]AMY09390.1 hypothetical protein LuPra_02605 [Luteitalea pratensis]
MAGDRKPFPFLVTPFNETLARLQDARWIAYTSDESGLSQVYVAPFPGPGDRSMISGTGGHMPRWSGDGKQMFFLELDGTVMAVGVNGDGAAFEFQPPQRLFTSKPNWSSQYHYDVTPDGQRFLMATPPDDAGPARPITVVLNWQPTSEK